MKYTKKPVTIDAIIWNGENIDEIANFMNWRNFEHDKRNGLIIRTLEGSHNASIGDYIIKGVKGEFYPCKPDIFLMTYDEAQQ